MILKKPYAFLIKKFKLIHFVLLLVTSYILIKSLNIYLFFNTYVKNNYVSSSYEGFSSTYVPLFMFVGVFFTVISVLFIIFLFESKKKPSKVYQFCFFYYIFLFVLIFITKSILTSFETSVITAEISRVYRDISLICLMPQLPFIIMFLIRSLGFNIKKFGFEKELKNLEITEKDNEEFEIEISHDGYKLKRMFRRFIREFNYYIRENKFIFACLCVSAIVVIIYMVVINAPQNYNKKYKEGDIMIYNGLNITVRDSILTNLDYKGEKIDDNYYLVLKLNINNNTSQNLGFKSKNFRLEMTDKYVYPIYDKSSNFIDFANDFYGKDIYSKTAHDYALVYKINNEEIKNKYTIKIYKGSIIKKNEIIDTFDYLNITPTIIKEINTESVNKIGSTVYLNSSNLLNSTVKVESYKISNRYDYSYNYCITKEDCRDFKDSITVGVDNNNKTLLAFDYKFSLDETSIFSLKNKNFSSFVEKFFKVKYIDKNNAYQYSKIKNVTPSNLKKTIVMEVDKDISESTSVSLAIIIREKEYLITLK